MATTLTGIKLDLREAIVKVQGSDGSSTITLNSNLVMGTRQVLDTNVPLSVGIRNIFYSTMASSTITIARNGVTVLAIDASKIGAVDLSNLIGGDFTNSASDILVTITGTAYLYITLAKTTGYKLAP